MPGRAPACATGRKGAASSAARRCIPPGEWLASALILLSSFAALAGNEPGRFDYYVLSLSWSPHYCTRPEARGETLQCGGRHPGFVVHGLWPQHERGAPEFCGSSQPQQVPREIVEEYLPIMPSARLIRHQWRKHGTCSGLTQEQYFASTRRAWETFRVPGAFEDGSLLRTDRRTLLARIRDTNPDIPPDAITLRCRGREFAEARICLSRELQPVACSAKARGNCPAGDLRVRPPR
ncbi:MAG TPA: ribonuclease T2 [Burkholderiales bacterium]|nr:ribonuclease T2 [Burkholderiales bacterium]